MTALAPAEEGVPLVVLTKMGAAQPEGLEEPSG